MNIIVYFILALVTVTQGVVLPCSEIVGVAVNDVNNEKPELDIYSQGKLTATIHIPIFEAAENWTIIMKFSRNIDSLTSDIAKVTGGNKEYNLVSLDDNGKLMNQSILSLPLEMKYSGGPPGMQILLSVDMNDKIICDSPPAKDN